MNEKKLIRMEKRATNKIGLFFVFFLTIIGLCVGGYFLYKNIDYLDFSLSLENENEKKEESDTDKDENNTSEGKLHLPEIDSETNIIAANDFDLGLYISQIKATPKGYVITFAYKKDPNTTSPLEYMQEGSIILNCEKILIDEYEVSPNFQLEFNKNIKTYDEITITIPISELNNLGITSFEKLTFFITMTNVNEGYFGEPEENKIKGSIIAYQDDVITNVKKIKKSYGVQNEVRISYYEKIEADDATYLYFLIENNNKVDNHEIEIKKLAINDKIYNDFKIKINSHYDSKNIFYIKIPKKEFRKINKFMASFFIIKDNDGEKTIFTTNELTFDLTK